MEARIDLGIETLVIAYYSAFDNRGSRTPAFAELRAMFADGARITRVTNDRADSWAVDAFITPRAAILTDGTLTDFHEWETSAKTVILENIASRWSTYEKAGKLDGNDYPGNGHKFIQFYRNENRWFISSILWEDL